MQEIRHIIREPVLFAGIRKPIKSRKELIPRMELLRKDCGDKIAGALTNIFRFDTPVDGYDSEIGFPVSEAVETEEIHTHELRRMHFFGLSHLGPVETLHETSSSISKHLRQVGLSPELEMVEIYHQYDPENQESNQIESWSSFLPWPETYYEQLVRVLGKQKAQEIWLGGDQITPFTLVDERVEWVAETLTRLKQNSTPDQQFDILSRVALVRPIEEINKFKAIYQKTGSIQEIFDIQHENLSKGPTGGKLDPPWYRDGILHDSKVSYNRAGYDKATNHVELRKAYCFCNLIREAADPKVDPIFCYRAAGWARQFWEPILEVEFKKCTITHSILKGDGFCAWNYESGGNQD